MNFSLILWVLYLLVYPFYFIPEGNPQVADAIGVLLLIANIRPIILTIFKNDYNRFLFFFVIFTFLINTFWMLILGELILLKSSLYYLYAFLIFIFVYSNLENEKFIRITVKIILASLIIQFILWPIIPDQGVRYQMFFNNPNQLALWGLCLLIISNAFHLKFKFKLWTILPISILCSFFVLLSASRSGIVCLALFWLFFYLKSMRNVIVMSAIVTVIIVIASVSNLIKFEDFTLLNYIAERLSGVEKHDGGLDARGYDRIVDFPQYLIFGAGEGVIERFNTKIELHSTFLNVLFSYGLIGLVIFGRSLIAIVLKSYREIIVLFLILAIFGHVHMTLRIPLFWITLGVLYYIRENRYVENRAEVEIKEQKTIRKPEPLKPIQF